MSASIVARVTEIGEHSPEWHAIRKQGLGGSDAPIVAGLSPWRSAYDLWVEKTAPETTGAVGREDKDYQAWGYFMEDPIAEWFKAQSGLGAERLPVILRSEEHPFMQANIDRVVLDEDVTVLGPLEIKNRRYSAGWTLADDGTVNVPTDILAQGIHYLAVGGWDRAWFAACLGGQPPVIAEIERTEALIADLVAIEEEFWDRVERQVAPPVDGSESTRRALGRRWKAVEGAVKVLRPEPARFLLLERKRLVEEIAGRTELVKEIEAELCSMLGPAEAGTLTGDIAVTWKEIHRSSLDAKALRAAHPEIAEQFSSTSSYRRFGVGKAFQPEKGASHEPE